MFDESCRFAVLAHIPSDRRHGDSDSTTGTLPTNSGLASHLPDATSASANHLVENDACQIRHGDLIAALSTDYLHVLARKITNLGCSCHQDPHSELLARKLHCPHVIGFDDYGFVAAIPLASIAQVLMTYRTTSAHTEAAAIDSSTPSPAEAAVVSRVDTAVSLGTTGASSVAARTQELILALSNGSHVWLAFEHNLARGAFLEALTAATGGSSESQRDIDVDYVDLSDAASLPVEASAQTLAAFPAARLSVASYGTIERDARFAFVRDALRLVIYDKVHLALTLTREQSSCNDPTRALALTTAIELARALDEPDLSAFAWLTNAFVAMQTATAERIDDKLQLAFTQAMHSIDIARTNGFAYLLALALHCASDVQSQRCEFSAAKELLVEAARVTPEVVEASLKMQLHRKIHDLRDCASDARTGAGVQDSSGNSSISSDTNTARTAFAGASAGVTKKRVSSRFSLWDHSDSARFKALLLRKVFKLPASDNASPLAQSGVKRSGSCFVDVVTDRRTRKAGTATDCPQTTRLRVFFDSLETIAWLKGEVQTRIRQCRIADNKAAAVSNDRGAAIATVEAFWVASTLGPHKAEPLEWTARLGEVCASDNEVLLATLALDSSTKATSTHAPAATQHSNDELWTQLASMQQTQATMQDEPMVTCSVCHARVPLDDAESHSELCE